MKFLKISELPNYSILTLNNPESLNAISTQMISELYDFFSKKLSESIRFVVITGEGKCFGAGADLKEMQKMNEKEALEISQKLQKTFDLIKNYPVPVIASVHGFAIGGAFELALACDMIFSTKDSYFLLPELKFDMIPGGGGTVRLTKKTGYQKAFWQILTAQRIDVQEAFSIGIVQKVLNANNYLSETIEILEKHIIPIEKEAVSALKKTLVSVEVSNNSAYQTESKNFSYLLNKYAKHKIGEYLNSKKNG